MIYHSKKFIILLAMSVLACGCVKDGIWSKLGFESEVKFSVVQSDVLTIDGTKGTGFMMENAEGESIPVFAETSAMTLNLKRDDTKGQRYGDAASFQSESFSVYGWDVDGKMVFSPVKVSYNSTSGKWDPATSLDWANKASMTFIAVYPESGCTFDNIDEKSMDFTYQTKASASDEKDLMLAYYSGLGDKGVAPLAFKHALTCVNFKVGELVDVESIDEISLEGVFAEGSCDVTESDNSPSFDWTPDKTKGVITVTSSGSVAKANFNTLEDNAGYNFLLIPQDVQTDNVKLKVTLTTTAGSKPFTVVLDNTVITNKWVEGKKNTFILGYDGENVTISVEDEVNDNVKEELKISNTGTIDAYFRVALVGNWQNEAGNIVGNWDETQGTFTGLTGTKWFKDGDYYYYEDPVAKASDESTPTEITNKLFTKYTAPAVPPIDGAKLYLNIVVQAVKYDKDKAFVTTAWGSTIAGKLNTK